MDKLVIEGGNKLKGQVEISGAKNAALPILFSTILTEEPCLLTNVPNLADIDTTVRLLSGMGIDVEWDKKNHSVRVQAQRITHFEAPYDLVRTMRASILVLAPLLSRYKKAKVSLPGGCTIGARPVDLHLKALEKMGAQIQLNDGYILATAQQLTGAHITFEQVSVGATENTLMAAALAHGTTILNNCAQEPEITDLAIFLKKLGAKIEGEGTSTIKVTGVPQLSGAQHSIIADRVEAGTYLISAAITGGEVFLPNVSSSLLEAVLEKLKEAGCKIETTAKGIHLIGPGTPKAINISTQPFPGFPTDMQAQFMALMSISSGTSTVIENIFENRFMHTAELTRLGARIQTQGKTATIHGLAKPLSGATVMATDLRASASLVLAGLAASGQTTVRRVYHLDRGYEHMEHKLTLLGAKIWREKEN